VKWQTLFPQLPQFISECNVKAKELSKSIHICQRYHKKTALTFFMTHSACLHCETKKTLTLSSSDNFDKYGRILMILSPLHAAMNSGRSFYIIRHLTSNPLPHYLVKFECSNEQPVTIVIQFKSVQSIYFQ